MRRVSCLVHVLLCTQLAENEKALRDAILGAITDAEAEAAGRNDTADFAVEEDVVGDSRPPPSMDDAAAAAPSRKRVDKKVLNRPAWWVRRRCCPAAGAADAACPRSLADRAAVRCCSSGRCRRSSMRSRRRLRRTVC